jgi:AmpD protein
MKVTDAAPSQWVQGWYQFARHLNSPNCGRRPPGACIDLVVVHSISLPPGIYGGDHVQRLFTNQLDWSADPYFQTIKGIQVSAHFYIQRSGNVWQFVSVDERAWHAGISNYRGRDNCNDDSVGIELEGIEGAPFEPAQYESLASLCAALSDIIPVRHVAGHEHIAPGRKTDPGGGFDWLALQQLLAWPPQYFPGSVQISN